VFELTPIVVIAPILPDRLQHVKRARDRPTIDPDTLKHRRVER
jgi:hypothetical protein